MKPEKLGQGVKFERIRFRRCLQCKKIVPVLMFSSGYYSCLKCKCLTVPEGVVVDERTV